MTYLYEELSAPTRLYIKQCSHCDLKYFGKTVKEDIESYPGSGVYWKSHLKKHNAESVHLWNSDWYYDTSIVRFATKFSDINSIVESNDWANLAIENGIQGGYLGEEVVEKASKSHKATVNDIQWIDTVGKEKSKKQSETLNDSEWKETIGKQKISRFLESMDYEKNGKKISEIKNDLEWIEKTYKECEFCGKKCDPGNYKKWHGDNCKKNPKFQEHKNVKICEYCNKGPMIILNYKRWHGDNCKMKEKNGTLALSIDET